MEEQAVPARRKCGAAAAYYLDVETQPEYRARQRELEVGTAQRMALGPEALTPEAPITVPIVVHVVYNDDSENISNEQIESQIAVLNQDYAATNVDKANTPEVWEVLVTDTNIRFVLASTHPDGNDTSGITRTQTDRTGFGINNTVKSAETGGALVEGRIDPTDRPLETEGNWDLQGDRLVLHRCPSETSRVMRIASVDDDRLIVEK